MPWRISTHTASGTRRKPACTSRPSRSRRRPSGSSRPSGLPDAEGVLLPGVASRHRRRGRILRGGPRAGGTQSTTPDSLASARYALGFVAYFQERFDDAGGLFEQSAADFATLNRAGLAVESLAMVAECALLRGDLEASGASSLRCKNRPWPEVSRDGKSSSTFSDGVDALLRGDVAACHSTFGRALKRVDETATKEWPLAHAVHTFYGVVLIVLGESRPVPSTYDKRRIPS